MSPTLPALASFWHWHTDYPEAPKTSENLPPTPQGTGRARWPTCRDWPPFAAIQVCWSHVKCLRPEWNVAAVASWSCHIQLPSNAMNAMCPCPDILEGSWRSISAECKLEFWSMLTHWERCCANSKTFIVHYCAILHGFFTVNNIRMHTLRLCAPSHQTKGDPRHVVHHHGCAAQRPLQATIGPCKNVQVDWHGL